MTNESSQYMKKIVSLIQIHFNMSMNHLRPLKALLSQIKNPDPIWRDLLMKLWSYCEQIELAFLYLEHVNIERHIYKRKSKIKRGWTHKRKIDRRIIKSSLGNSGMWERRREKLKLILNHIHILESENAAEIPIPQFLVYVDTPMRLCRKGR